MTKSSKSQNRIFLIYILNKNKTVDLKYSLEVSLIKTNKLSIYNNYHAHFKQKNIKCLKILI